MRREFLVSASLIGVLFTIVCAAAFSPARAQTPSMTPDMPPEIRSMRDEILSRDAYRELVDEWRAYIDDHPRSAVALVQLARAHRYAGTASVEERQKLIEKAFRLDPHCPEALMAMADTGLHSQIRMVTLEEARHYAELAVEAAPAWSYPHFTLWSLAINRSDPEEARKQLSAILDKDGFPTPLLDYAYNMLASAAPEAIIFTNGDNDTYPVLALQEIYGVRQDVLIVNLSLLNLETYALDVWKTAFGDRGPFTEGELKSLRDKWKRETGDTGEHYSTMIMKALLDKVRVGDWTKPVYFALTVMDSHLKHCDQELEIEGLLWRVKRARGGSEAGEEPAINLERTHRLLQQEFRLDSATDFGYRWTPESAIKPLMKNYAAILRLVATGSAEIGDLETVRWALRTAIRMMDFHGDHEMVRTLAEYWKQLDPNNDEVDAWL